MSDLWLSKITFDLRCAKTRRDLGTIHRIHGLVLRGFPGFTDRASAGALHAYTQPAPGVPPTLVVQSTTRPDWGFLTAEHPGADALVKEISPFWDTIVDGTALRFRLIAAPTISPQPAVRGVRGKRQPLRDPGQQVDWVVRQLRPAGVVSDVMASGLTLPTAPKGESTVTVTHVTFTGALAVTDAAALRALATAGVGSSKAYGCGLVMVTKVPGPYDS